MRKLSYVRIDKVEEVPLEILRETIRSDRLVVMLQERSFGVLQNHLEYRLLNQDGEGHKGSTMRYSGMHNQNL